MKFSIIIPIYNLESYIKRCVDSVLNQSFCNYEIILVNDGSTDKSKDICQRYISENVILVNKENGGLSDARNVGIKNASGDYLIFLDGDDFWSEKDFLKELNNILNKGCFDLIIFPFSYYYSAKNIKDNIFDMSFRMTLDFHKDLEYLVSYGIYTPSAWNKCIRRELFLNGNLYFPVGRLSEDISWCGVLSEYIDSYYVYNNICYMYQQNREGSITHKVSEKNVLHILSSIDEGLERARRRLDKTKLKNLEVYYAYSFLEVIPYVNPYLNNNVVTYLIEKHKKLAKYGFYFKDKKKFIVAITTGIFGFYISSFLLGILVEFYRYLNNKIK